MIDYTTHIQSNPDVMLGKPTIKGTRITVEHVLTKIASGYSMDEILEMYPHLQLADLLAAIGYAAAVIASEEVISA
jgi:uncharacterized protein (DUF433 family)